MKILLSDDNSAFRSSSIEVGAALGFHVVAFEDWERAQIELSENFETYSAVVIDGKGKLRDSTKTEDTSHLTEAISWLSGQRANGRYIPVVVYTGFYPEFDSLTTSGSPVLGVFDKSKTKFEEVLSFLKREVAKLPMEKFKASFPDAHEFGQKYFSVQNNELLLALHTQLQEPTKSFSWKKTMLDRLRLLNEALVDTIPLRYYREPNTLQSYLDRINKEMPPKEPRQAGSMGNRSVKIITFFEKEYLSSGRERFPATVSNVVRNIYYTASAYASHTQERPSDYFPSSDMVLGLAYSHFGCYHWFEKLLRKAD